MTKEEAIKRIQEHMIVHKMNESRAVHITEALDMAIKALEQNLIDSSELIDLLYDNNVRCDQTIEGLADDIMSLQKEVK